VTGSGTVSAEDPHLAGGGEHRRSTVSNKRSAAKYRNFMPLKRQSLYVDKPKVVVMTLEHGKASAANVTSRKNF